MADTIHGDVADDGQTVAVGKDIHQTSTDRSHRVNVYNHSDSGSGRSLTLEERVEDLERYTFGDNRYDEIGTVKRQKKTQQWVQGLAALNLIVILVEAIAIALLLLR